jgi:starch-binding outer membrane protein, SusD/RagB family
MKIKAYIFTLAAISFMLLLQGCNKNKLSPTSQTSLLDRDAFSTPTRMMQEVFGIYSGIKAGNFLGGRALVYNDVRGEDWLNVTGNGVTAVGVWNFSITSTDNQTENMWGAGYAAINRANVVLAGIDANPTVVTATTANQFRGEARFCRALAYFYLLNLYEKKPFNADAGASPGLPLRITAATTPEGPAMPRSTVAQVYEQILQDLNFAETNLPASYAGTNDSNVVRAHRHAAIAMKTRVYLHMGRYADVITEGNKLVPMVAPFQAPATGVRHRLAPAFLTVFRSPYTDLESIFSMPMLNTNGPGTQNGLALYHNAEFALNPSGILADANWKAADARRALVVGTAAPFRYSKFNDDNNNYVPILRYAEVMLNLAEALARTSVTPDVRAIALLNAVRQRSDATTTFAPATQADLINLILNERRIELLGEGFRSLDIMRQYITFPAKGSVAAVPTTAQAYVWPIPASELLYNSQMTPN